MQLHYALRDDGASGAKDDLLLQIRPLLEMSKPELQTVWKEMDYSDFEPVAKLDLLAALLCRLLHDASDFDGAQSQPSSSTPPVALPTISPTPVKSFKEAVASPARSSDCNNFGKRLGEVERSLKEHKRENNLRQHEQRLEQLERWTKQQNLILYNVTEGDEEKVYEERSEAFAEKPNRLGQLHLGADYARPLRLTFASVSYKHEFLKTAKDLRARGIRVDDDLTRAQQQERESLSDDFSSLKRKGHKPFFRGSELKYYFADKMHTCEKGKANRAPSVV